MRVCRRSWARLRPCTFCWDFSLSSLRKRLASHSSPQVPFVTLFPETSQGSLASSGGWRALRPSPPFTVNPIPHPDARACARRRRVEAQARARETVRVARARAGGALSQWKGCLPLQRFPPRAAQAHSGDLAFLGGAGRRERTRWPCRARAQFRLVLFFFFSALPL